MSWINFLKAVFRTNSNVNELPNFVPVTEATSDDEKRERVRALTPEEFEVYKWLREGYTLKWTAETLYKDLDEIRTHAKCVYHKLGVKNQRSLINPYGVLDKDVPKIGTPPWLRR